MYTRRDFGKVMLAAVPALPLLGGQFAAAQINSKINGVRMGLQSACFTFSGMGIDQIISTMVSVGLAEIDMMAEHVENYLGAPGVQLPGTGRSGPWTRPPTVGRAEGEPAAGAVASAVGEATRRGGSAGGGFGRGQDPAAREALRKWRLDVSLDRSCVRHAIVISHSAAS